MTLYSAFICRLILMCLRYCCDASLANKTASACYEQRLESTVFSFNKRELLMLAATLSVTAFGIVLYIAADNPGGPLTRHRLLDPAQAQAARRH
jgi:hypothetical protein